MLIAGFDIGGTKSAALAASKRGRRRVLFRRQISTTSDWRKVLDELLDSIIYDSGITPPT